MKAYFVLVLLCACYLALIREAGFTSANAIVVFLIGLSAPVWVSFSLIYFEMRADFRSDNDRN